MRTTKRARSMRSPIIHALKTSRKAKSSAAPCGNPAENSVTVARRESAVEPMCAYGCERNLGSCLWAPCEQRTQRLAGVMAQIEHELRTGTGRFAHAEGMDA